MLPISTLHFYLCLLLVVMFCNVTFTADLELKLERPLKVNASLSTVQQIMAFIKKGSKVMVIPESSQTAEAAIPKIEGIVS